MRRADWPVRLAAFLVRSDRRPYRLGVFDCCLFVADAVNEMTGRDLAEPFRGYETKRAGVLSMRAAGFRSVRAFVGAHLGAIDPRDARAGDVLFYGGVPAISQGRLAYAMSRDGVGVRALEGADCAFRV